MLLSKTVFIKQSTYMKKYYEDKGYPFIKRGYIMEVKVEDLPETSNAIVDTVCDFCGEPHKMTYCKYIGAKGSGICCYKCRHKKSKKTNIEKYGVENTSQLEENKEKRKIKETCLKKYGVECASQSPEIIAKAKKTLYQNDTCPSSKAQRYICNLLAGELNYSVDFYNLDIYLGNHIYVEYDGSGHNLQVKFGNLTQEDCDRKEEKRYLYLLSKGYKMIKIINPQKRDKLPPDDVIKQIINDGVEHIQRGGNAYIINLENFEITYK